MERRRFTPSTEALDARLLLSTSTKPTTLPAANLQQKTLRIERLPAYLETNLPGRSLPTDTVTALQADIRAIVGKLNRPPSYDLVATNDMYRSVDATASLSVADAAGLDSTFTTTLQDTGMSPTLVSRFQNDMKALAQYDSNGPDSAQLAATDYALILQTTLAVGRPIRPPAAPTLLSSDDTKPAGDHRTLVARPHLIGRYDAGTTVSLYDQTGTVLGTALVPTSGEYSVQPNLPLAPGKYQLRIRATDPNGDNSTPSKPYVLVILAPRHAAAKSATPGGPLSV